jgi:anti-sigma regulatory factor (Ser/Thr protein kinase)
VRAYAIQAGLTPARADLLMLAVSELATNTLLYTSDGGLVEMRAEDGGVVCEVTDHGPVTCRTARSMPPADASSGRGLAIVHLVCDDVAMRTEGARTVVRLWVKAG